LTAAPDSTTGNTQVYLPDFCAAGTLFVVLMVAEFVAIVLTLASHPPPGHFLLTLSKISFFVLWLTLLGTAVLCQLRGWLERSGKSRAFVFSFVVLEGVTLVVAELAWQLPAHIVGIRIIEDTHGDFLLRTLAISSIFIALAMRYLYVSSEWRRSIVLEAQARISALQALIRPHFLFNSMNTIASLTRTDPRQAEEAVEDLSDLLRVSLSSNRDRTTLKEELEVAAIYHRIEKLRLGDRLRIRWDIGELPMRARIPSLTIQPLIENAIYHGIELLPDGGDVIVSGRRDGKYLQISVANPVAAGKARSKDGNKMALANIRQRFELAYGHRASVDVDAGDDSYTVTLRFPVDEGET
jgi:two-component system sensor histidine kinase AlgZ